MLILTRNINSTIRISDNIKVTLLEIRGNQARIGIDAPREISVHREEIYDKLMEGKRKAQMELDHANSI